MAELELKFIKEALVRNCYKRHATAQQAISDGLTVKDNFTGLTWQQNHYTGQVYRDGSRSCPHGPKCSELRRLQRLAAPHHHLTTYTVTQTH